MPLHKGDLSVKFWKGQRTGKTMAVCNLSVYLAISLYLLKNPENRVKNKVIQIMSHNHSLMLKLTPQRGNAHSCLTKVHSLAFKVSADNSAVRF